MNKAKKKKNARCDKWGPGVRKDSQDIYHSRKSITQGCLLSRNIYHSRTFIALPKENMTSPRSRAICSAWQMDCEEPLESDRATAAFSSPSSFTAHRQGDKRDPWQRRRIMVLHGGGHRDRKRWDQSRMRWKNKHMKKKKRKKLWNKKGSKWM